MNSIRLLLLFGILSTSTCGAGVIIDFTVVEGLPPSGPNPTYKTNANGALVEMLTFKEKNFKIDTAKVLELLANSFNMEFPTNATLSMSDSSFALNQFIVIAGTNILLDVSPVLSLGFTNAPILSGSSVILRTTNYDSRSYGVIRGHSNISGTSLRTLTYDDSGRQTRDGKHTQFFLTGIQKVHQSARFGGGRYNSGLITEFNGAGLGFFLDSTFPGPFVLSGKFSNAVVVHSKSGPSGAPRSLPEQ